ncbi:hypothetical protein CLG85_011450 [Yangia mangrovi]|uniref:Uncharacterized protein n=1 Tax=Alloyangia mangrovi TaxID=1779329 RepID=A0ABT2KKL5_9RHOB|nr:hypothetical protein [Alloyangia mangrovi]MCT4370899.1 hypothetical protein [Alloyangia mangrovi]
MRTAAWKRRWPKPPPAPPLRPKPPGRGTRPESAEPESDLPAVDSLAAEAAFFAAEAGQAAGDEYDYEESAFDVAAAPAPRAVPLEEAQDEAADSVAAKLRRIRAVVSGGAAASAVAAQDESDQDDSALEGADTVAAVSAMLGSLASDEPAPAAPEVEAGEDTLAASLIEAVMTSEEEDVVAEAAPAPAPLALTSEFAAKPEALAEAQPAEQRRSPRRVRVVKVTRAAFDAAVASGQLEQMDEPKPSSSLSAEDEAELARELEAVKAELAAGLESEWDEVEDLDALSAAPAAEIPAEAEQVLADLEAETAEGAPAETAGDDEDWDDEVGTTRLGMTKTSTTPPGSRRRTPRRPSLTMRTRMRSSPKSRSTTTRMRTITTPRMLPPSPPPSTRLPRRRVPTSRRTTSRMPSPAWPMRTFARR